MAILKMVLVCRLAAVKKQVFWLTMMLVIVAAFRRQRKLIGSVPVACALKVTFSPGATILLWGWTVIKGLTSTCNVAAALVLPKRLVMVTV